MTKTKNIIIKPHPFLKNQKKILYKIKKTEKSLLNKIKKPNRAKKLSIFFNLNWIKLEEFFFFNFQFLIKKNWKNLMLI